MVWVKKDFKISTMGRNVHHQIRLLKVLSNLSLKWSDGTFTISQENLFQCLTTLISKSFHLMYNLYLPSFTLCSPGHNWLSGLWTHTAGSCPTFHPPLSPVLLNRSALNLSVPQSVLILVTSPTQMQDLALGLVELRDVHMTPIPQACHSPFPPANQMYHSACCNPRVHSVPWSISLMQIINNIGPNGNPGGTPLFIVSTWTLSYWLHLFACDNPATTLLIWQSLIKSINLAPRILWLYQYLTISKALQKTLPCPLMHSLHPRKPPD